LIFPFFQAASFGEIQSAPAPVGGKTDRDYDRLVGPVHVVRTELEERSTSGIKKGQVTRVLREMTIYDQRGRVTQILRFDSNNCMRSRQIIEYQDAASRSEKVFWGRAIIDLGRDGPNQGVMPPVTFKQSFKFDRAGNRSEVADYDPTGKLYHRALYKFDERGRVIEEASGDAQSIRSRCTLKYDRSGLLSEEECKRVLEGLERSEILNYKYESDSRGNWIKRIGRSSTTLFDGETRKIELQTAYRIIEYYDGSVGLSSEASNEGANGRVSPRTEVGVELKPCEDWVVRKSGGAIQASATKKKSPAYPPLALEKRISGEVLVEVTLDEGGKVVSVRSFKGPAELRSSAEEAARAWEFRPTYLSKVPVKVVGVITFNFTL
jgi:TonB family protein